MHEVGLLVDGLRQCGDRRAAGLALLGALVALVEQVLVRSRYKERAKVARASLHLRAGGNYQDLVVVDGQGAALEPETSATAWRLLEAAREPIALDVEAQRWTPLRTPLTPSATPVRWEGATRARLQSRRATHLAALPLRASGGEPFGMVILEIDCQAAVGRRFDPLAAVADELQLRVDLTGGLIRALPGAASASARDPLLPVVGRAMAGVLELLRVFCRMDQTILLRGNTGTGKSHLARWCHAHSARAGGPFVVSQPHAASDTLREAELFGWKKGAFTGATQDQPGRVARAEGGTLFLDEIDKLDLGAQGKLLRLLDDHSYSPLGEDRDRIADVRFIVGTNADLERAVAEGRFLEDLYYRIQILPVNVPPLRERADEIGPWAEHMMSVLRPGPPLMTLSPEAVLALESQAWPGNLRQLNAVVVRSLAFCQARRPGGRLVELEDVVRALRLDQVPPDAATLVSGLRALAASFLRASDRRAAQGGAPFGPDEAACLWSAVLVEAVRQQGGPREAFIHLGLEARLQGGNHLRTLRRERERLAALCEAVGAPVPPEWADVEGEGARS